MMPFPNLHLRSIRLRTAGPRFSGLLAIGAFCVVVSGCGKPFQVRESVTLTASLPAEKLVIHTDFGDIVVRGDSDATEIRAEALRIGRGATPSEAERALDEIEVSLAPEEGKPGVIIARAEHPKSGLTRSHAVRWQITAPPDVVIEAHTGFGDVEVRDFKRGLTISTAFGDIEADASGPMQLSSQFGDIELVLRAGNEGDVKVSTEFGEVSLRLPADRVGRLVAGTDFGSVDAHLEGLNTRLIRSRNHHFHAELGESATPLIDLVTEFGDVDIHAYEVD